MKILPKVWLVVTAAAILAAAPVAAGDRAALVGCDLLDGDGPEVTFVQVGGGSDKRRFVGGPDRRSSDREGRSCADALAELAHDGFEFKAFSAFGRKSDHGLWYFRSGD
jgi:hypothetical protein